MEFLRDPIWQFIGAILAVIAIAISIFFFYLQRTKKSLIYDVLLDYPLLSSKSGLENRVQILFDDKYVSNVYIFVLRIYNDGNVAILPTDFVEPLHFSFGDNSEILEMEIVENNPTNLKPKFQIDKNTITLHPLLLNGGDNITLKLLLSKPEMHFESNARIVGVNKIRKGSISDRIFSYGLFGLSLVFLSGIGFVFLPNLIDPMSVVEKARQAELVKQHISLIIGIASILIVGLIIFFLSVRKWLGQFKMYSTMSKKMKGIIGSSSDW